MSMRFFLSSCEHIVTFFFFLSLSLELNLIKKRKREISFHFFLVDYLYYLQCSFRPFLFVCCSFFCLCCDTFSLFFFGQLKHHKTIEEKPVLSALFLIPVSFPLLPVLNWSSSTRAVFLSFGFFLDHSFSLYIVFITFISIFFREKNTYVYM